MERTRENCTGKVRFDRHGAAACDCEPAAAPSERQLREHGRDLDAVAAKRKADLERWAQLAALDKQAGEALIVEKHGTDDQRERHGAGVLPEVELLALARTALLGPLVGLDHAPRYTGQELANALASHDADGAPMYRTCRGEHTASTLYYDGSTLLQPLTKEEWEAFKAIKALAPAGVKAVIRQRLARCCESEADGHEDAPLGLYVRVWVEWAEREIGRDVALEIPKVRVSP